jgi:YHS domain-containing protein
MFPPSRRTLLLGSLLATLAAGPVRAAPEPAKSPVNVLAGDRLAIHGYDPVAYFVDGGPREGRSDLAVEHGGAVWRFASEENRKRFRADPARYVPAYGGFCAYGVSQGYLVKIDPEAWTIVDERLHLNYDIPIRDAWLKDVRGFNAKADANWRKLVPAASARGGS